MPTGFSLHIGLNTVDQNHYGGLQDLKSAVNDAVFMKSIAETYEYDTIVSLHNQQATSAAVLDTLHGWADQLRAGDILFISYSGHGGQIDDPNYYTTDDRGADETWCLYDRQLLDDELYAAFAKFEEGVRILVVSDSCHSGTVTKAIQRDVVEAAIEETLKKLEAQQVLRPKILNGKNPYTVHFEKVYKQVMEQLKQNALERPARVAASVKLFAAAQDNQVAYDGEEYGRFTAMLKSLLEQGMIDDATGSEKLMQYLKSQYPYPTPNLLDYGAMIPAFDRYLPFKKDIPGAADVAGYRTPPSDESVPFAWRNVMAHDAPTTPAPNPLAVSVYFTNGAHGLDDLLPLLPEGVKNIRFQRENTFVVEFKENAFPNVWDAIYQIQGKAETAGAQIEVEPTQTTPTPIAEQAATTKAGGDSFEFLSVWPPVTTGSHTSFAWHLEKDYSQLAKARDHVMAALESKELTKRVRIAHFDTGYFPSHPAIWHNPNILKDLARSFVPGETNNKAIDTYYGDGEVQGHGLGTLALLAGWKMPAEETDGLFDGYFGAAPCAEVIPMRLGDGVIILDGESFVDAVDYAIETGCEVITMSRGGKPSLAMARAINKAYEAGIVVVTAAGNSIVGGSGFAKFGPRTIVWPARFERVIAACGVCQNHLPYDFEAQSKFNQIRGIKLSNMQGNWGPAPAMRYALAAYTPNVPWAVYRKARSFSLDGGGTSSATPQIAAAAALYIMKHRDEMERKGYYLPGQQWKKVEAVRRALFEKAWKDPNFKEAERYYGNGILKAMDALDVSVKEISEDQKMPKAESSWLGWSEAVGLFLKRRRAAKPASQAAQQAIALEISHVLMNDPGLAELYDNMPFELEGESWSEQLMSEIVAAVKGSAYCSATLNNEL